MRISDWSSDVCSSDLLESELRLPAYQGYLLFPDGLPVARISLTADHIQRRGPARQPGFIAGKSGMTLWEQMRLAPPEPSQPPNPPARSEEHTSELQSLMPISYAVFIFKNKNT